MVGTVTLNFPAAPVVNLPLYAKSLLHTSDVTLAALPVCENSSFAVLVLIFNHCFLNPYYCGSVVIQQDMMVAMIDSDNVCMYVCMYIGDRACDAAAGPPGLGPDGPGVHDTGSDSSGGFRGIRRSGVEAGPNLPLCWYVCMYV